MLRVQINSLHNVVTAENENVLNSVGPKLKDLSDRLYRDIESQVSTYSGVQEEVDNLRGIFQGLRNMKNDSEDRITNLEDNIGIF